MAKGMLLAAGRGTRLGSLTTALPKPLLPLANRPVMAYGLDCLRRAGITDVAVNVCYQAAAIQAAFGDGSAHGVTLHWSVEQHALGTAGGVKRLQHLLQDDTLVVIAGDALLDLDLAPVLALHHARGAMLTLVTLPVDDPSQYGVVVTDTAGRIVRFQEKPAPGTEISRQANTGVYLFDPAIFSYLPPETFVDFALDIFPRLLHDRLPCYAVPMAGYWTDIGSPGAYLQAHQDYLAGLVNVDGKGHWQADNLLAPRARVDGALLSRCVVGEDAVVPPGSLLTDCVVWPQTVIAEPRSLSNAIFTPWGSYRYVDGCLEALVPMAVG